MRYAVAGLLLSTGLAAADDGDVQRASELYKTAEAEMQDGHYEQAAQDYSGAYDLTKDPALLFKIGSANEKAGQCKVALVYFQKYLDEGKPTDAYQKLTEDRIAACKAAEPPPPPPPPPVEPPTPPPPPPPPQPHGNDAAWLMVGGTVALLTTAGVLAYSASSSEEDVKDLYVGLQGIPPTYDAATQKRYQDLLDEGHRYEHLSWAAFGLAGVTAATAAYLFWRHHHEEVVPVVAPHTAGVAATIRF